QALPEREGKTGECHTVNQRVPCVRFTGINGANVPLQTALVAQRTQALQLHLANAFAGRGEWLQMRLTGELLIERNQFGIFILAGVREGFADDWEFEWNQNFRTIAFQEFFQPGETGNTIKSRRRVDLSGELQSVCGTKLVHQRVEISNEI